MATTVPSAEIVETRLRLFEICGIEAFGEPVVDRAEELRALILSPPGLQQTSDVATLFKKNCAICHTLEAGKNKIGPSLAGVVGRKAGSVPGLGWSLPRSEATTGMFGIGAKLRR